MTPGPSSTEAPLPYPPTLYAACVIGLLMMVALSSQLDRNLTALLIEPIQQDLGLSDTRMSLIHGAAFAIFYTVMGVPFGRIVDHANRRNLIIVGLVAWSTMTLLCGLASSFWQLFFARVGVGIGEACLAPAAYSLIADYVAPRFRGRALAVYYTALVVGQGASLMLGALVFSAIPHDTVLRVPGLGDFVPWQLVFVSAALPGLMIAPLLLTIREVPRRSAEGGQAQRDRDGSSIRHFVRYLRGNARTFASVYSCYALGSFVGLSVAAWTATLLVRQFGLDLALAGLLVGAATVVGGVTGTLVSGALSDLSAARRSVGGRYLVPVLSWFLLLLSLLVWPLAKDVGMTVLVFTAFTFGSTMVSSTAPAVIQDLVPNHMRGQAVAVWLLIAGLVGITIGPTAVALVTDHILHDPQGLRTSILLVATPGALLGLLTSAAGLKAYDATRRRAAELSGPKPAVTPAATGAPRSTAENSPGSGRR